MAESFNHESTPEEIQERTDLDDIIMKNNRRPWKELETQKKFQEMLDAQ